MNRNSITVAGDKALINELVVLLGNSIGAGFSEIESIEQKPQKQIVGGFNLPSGGEVVIYIAQSFAEDAVKAGLLYVFLPKIKPLLTQLEIKFAKAKLTISSGNEKISLIIAEEDNNKKVNRENGGS